jgi:serine/threonine protein kinase
MGVVYLAEQLSLGRRVALKLIAPELASDPSLRARFEGEARIAASLDHPNIVPIYEAGEHDGQLFLAMRIVDGVDLGAVVQEKGRLGPAHAARIIQQVAGALDAAHSNGLVHRDIKPGNVLLNGPYGNEHVYLTDFGLTKRVGTQGQTRTGQWVGTLHYVAPEQITGGTVDARADIYALGCVLYELLTGNVPYKRPSDVAMMFAHVNDPPPSPCQNVVGLQPQFDEVINRAMAKEPGERYPSAGDLGRATVAAAALSTPQAPERTVAIGEAAPQSTGGYVPPIPEWQQHQQQPPPAPAYPSQQGTWQQPPSPPYGGSNHPSYQGGQPGSQPGGGDGGSRTAIIIAVLVVLLAAVGGALAIALAGGGDDGGGNSTSSSIANPTPDTSGSTGETTTGGDQHRFPYPESVINAFVTACERTSGGQRKTCECAIGKLQDTLPYAEFEKADQALREGKSADPDAQKAITDATTSCIGSG